MPRPFRRSVEVKQTISTSLWQPTLLVVGKGGQPRQAAHVDRVLTQRTALWYDRDIDQSRTNESSDVNCDSELEMQDLILSDKNWTRDPAPAFRNWWVVLAKDDFGTLLRCDPASHHLVAVGDLRINMHRQDA